MLYFLFSREPVLLHDLISYKFISFVVYAVLTNIEVDDRVTIGKQNVPLKVVDHFVWCSLYYLVLKHQANAILTV